MWLVSRVKKFVVVRYYRKGFVSKKEKLVRCVVVELRDGM